MSKIIGIDLGTTNSCVAVVEAVAPRVLANRDGSRTTPSIVAFAGDGDRLVGQIAKRQAITNPQNTVFAVKRLIGRKFDDPNVQRACDLLPYALAEAPNGDVKVRVRDRQYSPEELSSFLLRELKSFAEEALGEEVTEAIVTVPAYFDDSQRQATKDAGRIAGLEVLRILNEPTAAALAYGLDRQSGEKVIAVYDLGGGTFDISILQLAEGIFEVKATAGDTFLGGEDFDQRIIDWLVQEFRNETGLDLRSDRMALQRLKEAAERAKCELSTATETAVNLPFISADESGPRHLARTLTRDQFESLVADLVERTEGPCLDAVKAAGLRPDQIDEVLLVGGQTRSPCVARAVEKLFGRAPNREINPDEVVAVGAAIQAGILRGDIKDLVLLDVTPLSLGLETHGGLVVRLIERNATIPTKNTQIFTTVIDNQDTVEIHVVQGEREIAAENRSLGRFELVGIPAAPRGVPQIEVTFAIDSNGIVNVSARDMATNQSQSIQINPAGGLSNEEIERLVVEAGEHARADAARRELLRVKNRLEGLLYTNERVFEQYREMLSKENAKRINETLTRARVALMNDSQAELETATFDLNSISRLLSEAMLDSGKDS
ncbi:MAG: molecular chaperone DnaK [Acidobacteria bacterium]|nr:molecular chaperone DnaK [Thermoanaerobaculia bacterium]MDI9630472.1 molecular chaperone DnaK [Acidobacteriota bacterium]MBP7813170.1 molecular chaperone DnaK [Thermoanaerobaculia bacterium]NLN12007.1 molecular chaperone DnaK [Acidobacteriota bacterium]HPA95467.1 molecular chaperone DnaK [Thermoanaerobaculia bacterium]